MIDCSLYFSTICYVRLSKITAAPLLPRREPERIPLLQERCFPIASAKVGHFCIPCKTSTKKNARKIHLCPFCYFIALQNAVVKSVFSLHPLPAISHPKPPFFARFGHFWGENHLFRGVFLFNSREILAQNLCFRRKNQFDGVFLLAIRPKYNICRRGKSESRRRFLFLPTPLKNTSQLSLKTSPLFATSSLVLSQTSLPHTKSLSPYAQDTCLRVYTRPRTQRICLFYLHPSPHPATSSRSIDCG